MDREKQEAAPPPNAWRVGVTFRLKMGAQWVPIDQYLHQADILLAHYCDDRYFDDDPGMGGYFIAVDGVPWNGPGTVESFANADTWLDALAELLSGAPSAWVWAWEESDLTVRQDGNAVILEDVHHSGTVVCPQIQVDFGQFIREMLRESKKFAALIRGLAACLQREHIILPSQRTEDLYDAAATDAEALNRLNDEQVEAFARRTEQIEKQWTSERGHGLVWVDSLSRPQLTRDEKLQDIATMLPEDLETRVARVEQLFDIWAKQKAP